LFLPKNLWATIDNQKLSEDSSIITLKDNQFYLLGPSDSLNIVFIGIPEFNGVYMIGPDGNLILPRLNEVYAEGHTVDELRNKLLKLYEEYLIDPEIYMNIFSFRPIRIYVAGEVMRPGFHTLSGKVKSNNMSQFTLKKDVGQGLLQLGKEFKGDYTTSSIFPTVFDSLKSARGITAKANLREIVLIRKNSVTNGGGNIKTTLNLIPMITEGDEFQNIRVFDGDRIIVYKTDKLIKDQFLSTRKTNLSPEIVEVFVSGNVINPGKVSVPSGSGLNQAIAYTGGRKILNGKIEFLRFFSDGSVEKRLISFSPKASIDSYNNPVLIDGDVIRINRSILGNSAKVINEFAAPVIGIRSLFLLFN
tara:strand:+ start:1083 stop:2165 length:1083 start_codon:yes stop_codon:yes gene_type:complete